ncbi:MAG: Stp1/IreP family PP2C-type Ser/Thr phosphatase [Firmicutes bacterium]|nr:Stp1/IreP family PP2C-type Ser/Thr phosphatase [Bacillota bacterium]
MLEFGFKSDKGKVREINQDAFFVMPEESIFLVADGVGGHNLGELASRMTVADIATFVKENPIPEDADADYFRDYFLDLLFLVNDHVHGVGQEKALGSMATTIVMLYLKDGDAYVVNIGDSRAYLIRDDEMLQVTDDHTYVNDLVKKGIITKDEASNHPNRNMITRAIGATEDIKPDFFTFKTYPGDILVLCTDGLYGEVKEKDICSIIKNSSHMRQACAELVDTANSNGGGDNITVVAVKL